MNDHAARAHARLLALGPKPPWWRPFKRRRWMRVARGIVTEAINETLAQAWNQVWERVTRVQAERTKDEEARFN